jgi:pimeloyl-ACP methyl ester carboxylesterase
MRGEFVDLGGKRLYYYAAGTRGAGEPIIFLHGFPASSHLWHSVVREMPEGHRLVVVDLLCFGRSDRAGGGELTVRAHAERTHALMDELGIKSACVVGHGMGGAVAQAIALAIPERVTRLCLINSAAFERWPRRAARIARALAHTPFGRLLGAPLLAGLVHGSMLSGFEDEEVGRHALDSYLGAFNTRLGVDALVAQLTAMHDPGVETLGAELGRITQPTAVVWGERDPYLPLSLGVRLQQAIPGATIEIIGTARHFTPEDAPERVAAAVSKLLRR